MVQQTVHARVSSLLRVACVVLAVGAVAVPFAVQAAPGALGSEPGLIVSGERVMGIGQSVQTMVSPDGTESVTTSRALIGTWSTNVSPVTEPRIGVDYKLATGVTFGSAFGLLSASGEISEVSSGVTTTTQTDDVSGFILAPRLGYIHTMSGSVSVWLRGGISMYSVTQSDPLGDNKVVTSGSNLTIDPQVLVSATRNFAVALGLVVDLPISGSYEYTVTDQDVQTSVKGDFSARFLGVTVGFLGLF
jgi:hypothetical protein